MRAMGRTILIRKLRTVSAQNTQLRADNQQLREENEALRTKARDAYRDELTGTYNRRWLRKFWDALENPSAVVGAIFVVDVDRFKTINDRYGHEVGDRAIVHIARALRRHCVNVIRSGGDEFILLIPRDHDVHHVATSILAEAQRPMPVPSGDISATISVGAHLLPLRGVGDLTDLVEAADVQMYLAKRQNGNQVLGI